MIDVHLLFGKEQRIRAAININFLVTFSCL